MTTIPLNEITTIIGLQLGIRQVNGADHILQDLAAESIDIVNIIATIEEKYNIIISETALAAIGTVAELHQLVQQIIAQKEHDA